MKTSSAPQASGQEEVSFEIAFARLEEILERINSGVISLEESLKLYEEADRLIALCNTKLVAAEQKVEMLMKNRQGEIALNEEQKPITQEYSPKTFQSEAR